MNKHIQMTAALAVFAAMLSTGAAHAADSQAFTSFDVQKNSWYVYAGGVTALSGEDILTQDGWLARASVGYGRYDYDTTAVVGGNVDGRVTAADLMFGYQHYYSPKTRVTAYLGGSVENQHISPRDANNRVRGGEAGVKGQIEFYTDVAENVPFRTIGSYSTGFDTYWSQTSVGYDFGDFTVGPELGFQGNEAYNEVRYGAAISDIDLGFTLAKVYAGGEHSNRDNSSGAYGGVGFFRNF